MRLPLAAALAAAAVAAAPVPQPPACAPNLILGAALGLARDAASGYALFLRSAAAAAPHARVELLVDERARGVLAPLLLQAPWGARVTLHAPEPDAVPSVARALSPQLARYWLYERLLARLLAAQPPRGGGAGAGPDGSDDTSDGGDDGDRCPPEPLVLLTDTRDVVFQRDPFVELEAWRAAAAAGREPPPVGAHTPQPPSLPPLFVFAEPAFLTLGGHRDDGGGDSRVPCGRRGDGGRADSDTGSSCAGCIGGNRTRSGATYGDGNVDPFAWTARAGGSILRPAAWAPLAPLPVLCSGTSAGALSAVAAYARALAGSMAATVSGGRGYLGGADQPLHNLLVYHAASLQGRVHGWGALVGTRLRSSLAAGAGDDVLDNGSAAGVAGGIESAAGATAATAAAESALRQLASALAPLEAAEPAYAALLSHSRRLSREVTVVTVPHEAALVCTLGLWPHNRVPVRRVASADASGGGDGDAVRGGSGAVNGGGSGDLAFQQLGGVAPTAASTTHTSGGASLAAVAAAATAAVATAVDAGGAPFEAGGAYPDAAQLPPPAAWHADVVASADLTDDNSSGRCCCSSERDDSTAAGAPPRRGSDGRRCALVHQYDRHMQLWKWADVRWGGVPAERVYCDTALRRCW